MTDSIEPNDRVDPRDTGPTGQDWEMIASLANALQHIDASLDDIRDGFSELINRDKRTWALLRRLEAILTLLARTLDEGEAEEGSREGGGF
jgi:hypothetical protein